MNFWIILLSHNHLLIILLITLLLANRECGLLVSGGKLLNVRAISKSF
jgi:hypothetical protein